MDGDDLREAERLGPAPPVPEPGRARAALRLATIDLGPLRRHRDFRLLFISATAARLPATARSCACSACKSGSRSSRRSGPPG
jgi:hypothetical protein